MSQYTVKGPVELAVVTCKITYPASDGACTVVADGINGISAAVDTGVTTVTMPSGAAGGCPIVMMESSTIDTTQITSWDPSTPAFTFTTLADDGTSGVPAAASPAEDDVAWVTMLVRLSSVA